MGVPDSQLVLSLASLFTLGFAIHPSLRAQLGLPSSLGHLFGSSILPKTPGRLVVLASIRTTRCCLLSGRTHRPFTAMIDFGALRIQRPRRPFLHLASFLDYASRRLLPDILQA